MYSSSMNVFAARDGVWWIDVDRRGEALKKRDVKRSSMDDKSRIKYVEEKYGWSLWMPICVTREEVSSIPTCFDRISQCAFVHGGS